MSAVHRLQIKASRLATDIFAGEYRSAFRGRGIEFDEVREYQPGDDIRTIDWNVTASQGRPFVKRFIEERAFTLVMLLDRSPSMNFGTVRSTKLQTATEACALLAFAALRTQDKMALLTLGDGELSYLRPGKGKHHVLRLIRASMMPDHCFSGEFGLSGALDRLSRILKERAFVFIISDFQDPVPQRSLAAIATRHETVAVSVTDPAERELPAAGLLKLSDAESGIPLLIDSGNLSARREYERVRANIRRQRKEHILATGASYLELGTEFSPLHSLLRFFRNRVRNRHV